MTETQRHEAYARYRAAEATPDHRSTLDHGYTASLGPDIPSTGTDPFSEQGDVQGQEAYALAIECVIGRPEATVAVLTEGLHVVAHEGGWKVLLPNEGQSGGTVATRESSTPAKAQLVVNRARRRGLREVADRLENLFSITPEEDEDPLSADAAGNFVKYCIARGKRGRPLLTVTPTGDLGATWKGPNGERVIMRFFASGAVWIAYKLLEEKGSLETTAERLAERRLRVQLPEWA